MSELRIRITGDGASLESALQREEASVKRFASTVERTGTPALHKMGSAASFSGEKMAKFGTVSLALTGTMSKVGVSSDALGKSFGILGDLAMGAVNPLYLVVGGLGAFASAAAVVIDHQKREKEAIQQTNEALYKQIELNRKLAEGTPPDPLSGRMVAKTETELRKEIEETERKRAKLEAQFRAGGQFGTAWWSSGSYKPTLDWVGSGDPADLERVWKPFSEGKLAKMYQEASDLTDKLVEARASLQALYGVEFAGPMPEDPMTRYAREWAAEQERQRKAADEFRRSRLDSLIPGPGAGMGPFGSMDLRQRSAADARPWTVGDTFGQRPFSDRELYGMGGYDAVHAEEEARKREEQWKQAMKDREAQQAELASFMEESFATVLSGFVDGWDEATRRVQRMIVDRIIEELAKAGAIGIARIVFGNLAGIGSGGGGPIVDSPGPDSGLEGWTAGYRGQNAKNLERRLGRG